MLTFYLCIGLPPARRLTSDYISLLQQPFQRGALALGYFHTVLFSIFRASFGLLLGLVAFRLLTSKVKVMRLFATV